MAHIQAENLQNVQKCVFGKKLWELMSFAFEKTPCISLSCKLQSWSQGLEISFYTHFAPPHLCAMLTKHFDLTQVCI